MSPERALEQLERDGLLRREHDVFRTTKRWQAAMSRAALRLYRTEEGGDDLRVPIVAALLDLCGPDASSEQIAALTEAMLPIETAELDPRQHILRGLRGVGRTP